LMPMLPFSNRLFCPRHRAPPPRPRSCTLSTRLTLQRCEFGAICQEEAGSPETAPDPDLRDEVSFDSTQDTRGVQAFFDQHSPFVVLAGHRDCQAVARPLEGAVSQGVHDLPTVNPPMPFDPA
jgi:hypothetical protein